MSDTIHLEDVVIPCVIGVLEREQRTLQPLSISVTLELELEPAQAGDLAKSVNYADIADQLTFLAQHGRWRLLESLLFASLRLLLAQPAAGETRVQVQSASVSLRKPAILESGVPGVSATRELEWCDLGTRLTADRVWIDTLVETARAGAYRVHIEPGARFSPPAGLVMRVLGGMGRADGRLLCRGDVLAAGEVASIEAGTEDTLSLLVVGTPPISS